jgi:PAS domain S-box-containing protein
MVKKVQLKQEKEFLQLTSERKKRFYQTLLKNIGDFVFLFDEKGDLVYLSPSANQLTGFGDLEGKQLFEYIHPDDKKTFFHLFKRVLKKPDSRVEAHFRILHKAGHYIWIEGGITNLVKDDAIEAFVLSCRDVTERRETEQAMVRLNRLYASIGQVNRAILSVEDEQALLKEVCYIATEFGAFKMAFVSVLDPLTGKLKLMQSSGVAEQDVEPSMVVQDLELAPFTSVLQTGQSYVCNDVQNELDEEYWKYVAMHKGFRSFVILPLSKSNRIIGVFVLAAPGVDAFTAKETELLEETLDDISFKLDVLKKEHSRAGHIPRLMQYPFKRNGVSTVR